MPEIEDDRRGHDRHTHLAYGKAVAVLQEGDPFIFGLGAEIALAAARVTPAWTPIVPPDVPSPFVAFGVAMIAVLWSYDGWIEITYVAGEVKDPGRNLHRALVISTATVVVFVVALVCARPFLLLSFDPEQADVAGFSSRRYHLVMLILVALTVIVRILIVPLAAFDRRGNRIGYGAGYYDMTINRLRVLNRALITIGLAVWLWRTETRPWLRRFSALSSGTTLK